MPNLPPDVLHLVFDFIALAYDRPTDSDMLRSSFLSVLQVCRAWKPVGEEKLYRSIRIAQGPFDKLLDFFINELAHPDSLEVEPHSRVSMLERTLSENANLAALVRKLEFHTLNSFQRCDAIMAKSCLAVLSLVPRLVHLDIDDISAYDFELLRATIVHQSELKFLRLKSGHADQKRLFYDALGLIRLASSLPKLTTLVYDDFTDNENSHLQHGLAMASRTTGGLPDSRLPPTLFLRKLNLTATAPFLASDLDALKAIVLPHLQVFSVALSAPSPALDVAYSLAHILTSCSRTLTQIHLLDLPTSESGTAIVWLEHRDPWAPAARAQFAAALRGLPHLAVLCQRALSSPRRAFDPRQPEAGRSILLRTRAG